MEKQLLSISEFSEACNVSKFTTRRLINSKALRSVRVSRRVMIPRIELDRVLAEGCGPHVKMDNPVSAAANEPISEGRKRIGADQR